MTESDIVQRIKREKVNRGPKCYADYFPPSMRREIKNRQKAR